MQESQPEILGSAKLAVSRLKATFPAQEAEIIVKRLTEWLSGRPLHYFWTHPDEKYSPEQQKQLENALERLLSNEPIQYIIGVCWFMGHPFRVSPHVLIPRPETEELVEWIMHSFEKDPPGKVVDVGTGSGCIAISLSLALKGCSVTGIDVSAEALEIALYNKVELKAEVQFTELDVFKASGSDFKGLDLIVSNPPYVLEDEKGQMQPNVLDFEPSLALFVPDDDPLLFYRHILKLGREWLKPGGWVYFEINEGKGEMMEQLGADLGYAEATLKKDLQGKYRMIRFRKP